MLRRLFFTRRKSSFIFAGAEAEAEAVAIAFVTLKNDLEHSVQHGKLFVQFCGGIILQCMRADKYTVCSVHTTFLSIRTDSK